LPQNIKSDSSIGNAQANDLITHAVRAYCFKQGDAEGDEIVENLVFSNDEIDYQTENRILIHLVVSAESSIIEQRDGLSIKEKINLDEPVKIIKLQKLQSSRSTYDFYEI
jgi:hypothetical protein